MWESSFLKVEEQFWGGGLGWMASSSVPGPDLLPQLHHTLAEGVSPP